MGNTNFLLSESIKGRISVDLKNTPWENALHSILAGRGLRLVRNEDIYWIGPHGEIQAFQKYRREDAALPFGGDHINSPRQILIEARIVEADERFAGELGIKLGYQAQGINGNAEKKIVGNMDLGGTGLNGFNPATMAATLVSKMPAGSFKLSFQPLNQRGTEKHFPIHAS
ncbi:secretin and TonB N-terminal domain-containing protein [Polynucleobacter necessarius]|uniref:secretin and TonB N-terminal domain-containing protein n=1 Tax=Polynucleobacter necessarius TaxID=576610 RepID=UPI001E527C61|nr:secretin and TonB N-terminal domain-containing protein [Polynucleobacter necessarius]